MASVDKILEQLLRGTSDPNIAFNDLRRVLLHLGFEERTKGGHHIFRRACLCWLTFNAMETAQSRIKCDR